MGPPKLPSDPHLAAANSETPEAPSAKPTRCKGAQTLPARFSRQSAARDTGNGTVHLRRGPAGFEPRGKRKKPAHLRGGFSTSDR